MIVTRKIAKIDTTNKMTVAFDVSSGKMGYYSEITGKIAGNSCKEVVEVQDEIRNTTGAIRYCVRLIYAFSVDNASYSTLCRKAI